MIYFSGIQYSGAHLRELQKAFKNPAGNVGLIFGEATKRAFKSVGLGASKKGLLTPHVHNSLSHEAGYVTEAVDLVGQGVEGCLMKYGKGIVEQQFVCNRLAEAVIDTYAMACVLSRATQTIEKNLPSAEHETLMTRVFCSEVEIYIFFYLLKSGSEFD